MRGGGGWEVLLNSCWLSVACGVVRGSEGPVRCAAFGVTGRDRSKAAILDHMQQSMLAEQCCESVDVLE